MDIVYRALLSITGVAILSFLLHIVFHAIVHRSFYSKPLAKTVGFTVASVGVFIVITCYSALRQTPAIPEQLSIEKIPAGLSSKDHLWVTVLDGRWDCENIAIHDDNDTFAALVNSDETVVIVASFDEKMTCPELQGVQPSGRLAEFVHREFIYTSNFIDFSKYGPETVSLSLCAYCGRQNTQVGIVAGIIFTILGLFYDKAVTIRASR
jgi:hypothetical protein